MTPPNILFLMTDQMQGRVLDPDSPCKTPNFDRLAARGVRITRAYTPNAVCSPARASLMTGLLPHTHGVIQVTHCLDDDDGNLRTEHPHWAQRLADAGYRTGYFGKWHVERTDNQAPFGWQEVERRPSNKDPVAEWAQQEGRAAPEPTYSIQKRQSAPPGYRDSIFYGVNDRPAERRSVGLLASRALEFLQDATRQDRPWCCFVSCNEPHDPFICGQAAFDQYDVDNLPIPPNFADDLANRPGLYRKAARAFAHLDERDKKMAMACYYASITEIDQQYGRLLDYLEKSGQIDNTIVILTSDHGEMLGAHGLYTKNTGAFEEAYNIPMLLAGPGIARGKTSQARVGLHDLCPTICDLAGAEPINNGQSRSFRPVLDDPQRNDAEFTTGYAEYYGTRYWLSQRILWDGPWKLVFNGFDFDELYNIDDDPFELNNLAGDPAHQQRHRNMMTHAWSIMRKTGDVHLLNAHYPGVRYAEVGPLVLDEPTEASEESR